jgi:hypothetical protein
LLFCWQSFIHSYSCFPLGIASAAAFRWGRLFLFLLLLRLSSCSVVGGRSKGRERGERIGCVGLLFFIVNGIIAGAAIVVFVVVPAG